MIEVEQNTNGWIEWRGIGVGASDANIIMGLSPYLSPRDLWELKLKIAKPKPSSFVANLGHKFEPMALAQLNLEKCLDLEPKCAEHAELNFIRASFDGLDKDEKVIAEIKYMGKKKLEECRETEMPWSGHFPQVQQQFLVSGFTRGYYAAYTITKDYTDIDEFLCIEVEPDLEYIAGELVPKLKAFWECVQNKTEPSEDMFPYALRKRPKRKKKV